MKITRIISLFTLAVWLVSSNTVFSNRIKSDVLTDQAINLMKQGNYAKSIPVFNQAINLNKNNLRAFSARATSKFCLKKYDQAINDYNKAINRFPKPGYQKSFLALCYARRALAYLCIGWMDNMANDFRKAAALGDTSAQIIIRTYNNFNDYTRIDKNKLRPDYILSLCSKLIADFNALAKSKLRTSIAAVVSN